MDNIDDYIFDLINNFFNESLHSILMLCYVLRMNYLIDNDYLSIYLLFVVFNPIMLLLYVLYTLFYCLFNRYNFEKKYIKNIILLYKI